MMEDLKAGSVVYLCGDLDLEWPLTVTRLPAAGVEVAWIDKSGSVHQLLSPRTSFVTLEEAYAARVERSRAVDRVYDRHAGKKSYGSFEGY